MLLSVVNSSVDAIVQIGVDGRILSWNGAAAEMFDYALDDPDRHILDLTPEDRHDEQLQMLEAVLSGQRLHPIDTLLLRRDGTLLNASIALSPTRDSDGAISGAAAIIRDITDRVRETEQVCQRQRLEAVGRLAGSIAHDFNNLLMAILGHADMGLAEVGINDESVREDLTRIVSIVAKASELTTQLLAFSRERTFSPRSVYVSEVVTRVGKLMRRLAPEHTIIEVEDHSASAVRIDANQLEQVLVNVAVNACDAMPDGGTLLIQAHDVDHAGDDELAPGEYVVLRVIDDGVGMTEETRQRAFDPYYTTKQSSDGTGMGLSVAYGIVSRADGQLVLHSRQGAGTVVEVWLPRATPSDRLRASSPPPSTGGDDATPTVLVVEDDAEVRAVAVRILRRSGRNVLEAANGAEALALLDDYDGTVDLVLTDAVMPVMGGHELIRRLREARPECAVLMMSGYRGSDDVDDLLALDDIKFIRKPFSAGALANAVDEALSRKRRAAGGPQ